MKRVLLIGEVPLSSESNGVRQKLLSQASAFTDLGAQVDCIGFEGNKVVLSRFNDGNFVELKFIKRVPFAKLKRFPFWLGIKQAMKVNEYDLVYIRYPIIDFLVLGALKRIRKTCKKVVIEIPSYPLEIQNASAARKCLYWFDSRLHGKCRNLVDKILYVGNSTNIIFGCPAEQIPNGIPEQIKQTPSTGYIFEDNTINLICVSSMSKMHGYDRLLEGLAVYYNKSNPKYEVNVTMVGNGPCKNEYKELVKKYKLEKHVTFPGVLKGDALTEEYKKATIGIGGLGFYRGGFQEASSLKTKEYLIRGLPFVYAVNEIGITEDFRYALKLPNEDGPVSIESIVQFACSIKKEPVHKVVRNMKDYAYEKFDWKLILQKACGLYLA